MSGSSLSRRSSIAVGPGSAAVQSWIRTCPGSHSVVLVSDYGSELSSSYPLRFELFPCSLHHAAHNLVNSHQWCVSFGCYLDFPFSPVGAFERVSITRTVDRMPRIRLRR